MDGSGYNKYVFQINHPEPRGDAGRLAHRVAECRSFLRRQGETPVLPQVLSGTHTRKTHIAQTDPSGSPPNSACQDPR